MLTRKLEQNNFFCRMLCPLCGSSFKPDSPKWRLIGQDVDFDFICSQCGEADLDTLRERIQDYVKYLRHEADMLEALNIDDITTDVSNVPESDDGFEEALKLLEEELEISGELVPF